jgi:hypothetical protein
MRSVKQIRRVKYTGDWISNVDMSNITYRLFTYNGLNWNVILRNNGIGGWTIRLCSDNSDELYVFNSRVTGVNRMFISINDDLIYELDGWYYEDITELKNRLENDLIVLLRKYEEYIET